MYVNIAINTLKKPRDQGNFFSKQFIFKSRNEVKTCDQHLILNVFSLTGSFLDIQWNVFLKYSLCSGILVKNKLDLKLDI